MSINISNHKFGLVYPGLGTVVFRKPGVVPRSLFTQVDYLGKPIDDYALNFSRASSQVICQYYNFLRLGEAGYQKIMKSILKNASSLAGGLLELKCKVGDQDETCFELLTSHEKGKNGEIHVRLPNIVVKLNEKLPFKAEALTPLLKVDGWSVPSYRLPKNLENVSVLRMVVKENFSADMVDLFMDSMKNAIKKLTEDKVTAGSNEIRGYRVIC